MKHKIQKIAYQKFNYDKSLNHKGQLNKLINNLKRLNKINNKYLKIFLKINNLNRYLLKK